MDFMLYVHLLVRLFVHSVHIFCFMGKALTELLIIFSGILGALLMSLAIYLTIESFIERKDLK